MHINKLQRSDATSIASHILKAPLKENEKESPTADMRRRISQTSQKQHTTSKWILRYCDIAICDLRSYKLRFCDLQSATNETINCCDANRRNHSSQSFFGMICKPQNRARTLREINDCAPEYPKMIVLRFSKSQVIMSVMIMYSLELKAFMSIFSSFLFSFA